MYVLVYYINNRSYLKVVKKKMSYLTIFYEIKLPLIRESISKCELFIEKINREQIKVEMSENRNEESINSYFLSKEKSSGMYNKENSNDNSNNNTNNYKKEEINKIEKKTEINKKTRNLQLIFAIILGFSFLYECIVCLLYMRLIKCFVDFGEYRMHLKNYHMNIIELFNAYREYLYDNNCIINNMPVYDYLIYKENEIYSIISEYFYYLKSHTDNYKFFNNDFMMDVDVDECCYLGLYLSTFGTIEECDYYLNVKEGVITLGFNIYINYFIEEIRLKRNHINKLLQEGLIVGNLSENDKFNLYTDEYFNLTTDINFTNDTDDLNLTNDTDDLNFTNNTDVINFINGSGLIFRLQLFNDFYIHKGINFEFFYIIYPYIETEKTINDDYIRWFIKDGKTLVYIILIVAHITINLLFVFFYLIPKIKFMNEEIYNTKNMLSIIPIHILASLPNIRNLLNISNTKMNDLLSQKRISYT
jgi:hypothetical protein